MNESIFAHFTISNEGVIILNLLTIFFDFSLLKHLAEAIDGSLKRLKTDYIDLYQLHWPERSTNTFGRREYTINKNEGDWNDFENILQALQKFIKSGKIRHIGLSNETPYGLSKYLELSKHKNLPRMMSVQNPYSLVNRNNEIGM